MSSPSTIPLIPLLIELFRGQEEADEREAEARRTEWTERRKNRVLPRMEELVKAGMHPADAEAKAAAEVDNAAKREAANRDNVSKVRRTPWTEAVSFLCQHVPAHLAGDPVAGVYRSPDEPSQFESALREYLCRVRRGALEEPTPLSEELARLGREGVGDRLAKHLQRMPEEMRPILEAVRAAPEEAERAKHTPKVSNRGRIPDTDSRDDKRVWDAWRSGEHKDYAALALALGKSKRDVKCAVDRQRHRLKPRKRAK
jgi:hypothetical protein